VNRNQGPRTECEAPGCRTEGLDRADVLCLRALLTLGDVELHPLVLIEAAVAVGCDGRVVDEYVRAAAVLGDEAEALLGVEPLNCALRHVRSLLGRSLDPHLAGRTLRRMWPRSPEAPENP